MVSFRTFRRTKLPKPVSWLGLLLPLLTVRRLYQFLCTQDDELERTKRSPRDRQYDDDIEYDMGEPVQMGHFKHMDEKIIPFFPDEDEDPE